MAFSRYPQFNITVGGTTAETTLQSSASYSAVTFTFDRPMPVGYFVTGEPFVVSDQAFAITAISPASGDLEGDGYVGNGAMRNPAMTGASTYQGFDAYLADYPPKVSYQIGYDGSLNVDPAVSGNLEVKAGEKTSIVKSVRETGKTSITSQWAVVNRYAVLTVLDMPPPVEAFRPGMSGKTKKIRTRADVDFTPRNIEIPSSWPSISRIISEMVDNVVPLHTNSERIRFLRTDGTIATVTEGYSRDTTPLYSRYIYLANAAGVSAAERQEVIDRIITNYNDIEAALAAGIELSGGAGQGGGVWEWGMAAAALLKDPTIYQSVRTGGGVKPHAPDRFTFWVTSSMVGLPAPGSNNVSAQPYFDEHVGLPHGQPDEYGSHFEARYVETFAGNCVWEYIAILAFAQGPGSFANGYEMILDGGAFDAANPYAAGIGFASRWLTWNMDASSQPGPSTQQTDAWEGLVAVGALTPWTGQPEQPPVGSAPYTAGFNDPYFSPGNGSITFDVPSNFDYATEPITRRDFRFSLDNIQWVEDIDVDVLPYTRSGLLRGVKHWCGWRQASASGVGAWSGNYPYATPVDSGADRNTVTPTGSLSNTAPVSTIAPLIHIRKYSGWDYKVWSPANSTLGTDEVEIASGIGYWSGHPAPDFETGDFKFQWQESVNGTSGWTDISTANGYARKATGQTFIRRAENAEQFLRCEITCTTSQGQVVAYSNVVELPSIQVPPEGTLIDTDFRGAFAVDYETELNTLEGVRAVPRHDPTMTLGLDAINLGGIIFEKTSGTPLGNLYVSRTASLNTTYNFTAQFAIDGDNLSDRGDFRFRINEVDGEVLFEQSVPGNNALNTNIAVDIAGSFTTGSSIDALMVQVGWISNTGGKSGGNPGLSQLTIIQA